MQPATSFASRGFARNAPHAHYTPDRQHTAARKGHSTHQATHSSSFRNMVAPTPSYSKGRAAARRLRRRGGQVTAGLMPFPPPQRSESDGPPWAPMSKSDRKLGGRDPFSLRIQFGSSHLLPPRGRGAELEGGDGIRSTATTRAAADRSMARARAPPSLGRPIAPDRAQSCRALWFGLANQRPQNEPWVSLPLACRPDERGGPQLHAL